MTSEWHLEGTELRCPMWLRVEQQLIKWEAGMRRRMWQVELWFSELRLKDFWFSHLESDSARSWQGHLVGGLEHFLFSIIYGMSSFPLTNSYFSRWFFNHQPVMHFHLPARSFYDHFHGITWLRCSPGLDVASPVLVESTMEKSSPGNPKVQRLIPEDHPLRAIS